MTETKNITVHFEGTNSNKYYMLGIHEDEDFDKVDDTLRDSFVEYTYITSSEFKSKFDYYLRQLQKIDTTLDLFLNSTQTKSFFKHAYEVCSKSDALIFEPFILELLNSSDEKMKTLIKDKYELKYNTWWNRMLIKFKIIKYV